VCSKEVCVGEPPEFQFMNAEGYNDFAVPRQSEDRENQIPYVNDEIPSSREEWDDIPLDDGNPDNYVFPSKNDIDDPRFAQPIQDVDLDDQEAEEINELPDDYRFKRNIFI